MKIDEKILKEAKTDAYYSAGTDQNDWLEGWDDAIEYLKSIGVLKVEKVVVK